MKSENLEQFIAQTKAEIKDIDLTIAEMKTRAEALRVTQVELNKVLKKLEAPDIVEVTEPAEEILL